MGSVWRVRIRATHPAGFRSGEWGDIVDMELVQVGRSVRFCYVVEFSDGVTDQWPVLDPLDPYEIDVEYA